MLIKPDNKLLHAHLSLLQLHDLTSVCFPTFLLPVLVQPNRHDNEQGQAVVLHILLFHL